jgi:hypothetical protein
MCAIHTPPIRISDWAIECLRVCLLAMLEPAKNEFKTPRAGPGPGSQGPRAYSLNPEALAHLVALPACRLLAVVFRRAHHLAMISHHEALPSGRAGQLGAGDRGRA